MQHPTTSQSYSSITKMQPSTLSSLLSSTFTTGEDTEQILCQLRQLRGGPCSPFSKRPTAENITALLKFMRVGIKDLYTAGRLFRKAVREDQVVDCRDPRLQALANEITPNDEGDHQMLSLLHLRLTCELRQYSCLEQYETELAELAADLNFVVSSFEYTVRVVLQRTPLRRSCPVEESMRYLRETSVASDFKKDDALIPRFVMRDAMEEAESDAKIKASRNGEFEKMKAELAALKVQLSQLQATSVTMKEAKSDAKNEASRDGEFEQMKAELAALKAQLSQLQDTSATATSSSMAKQEADAAEISRLHVEVTAATIASRDREEAARAESDLFWAVILDQREKRTALEDENLRMKEMSELTTKRNIELVAEINSAKASKQDLVDKLVDLCIL
jgi:hypothetical protein